MLKSIGNSPEEEKEGYSETDLQKRKVLRLEWKNAQAHTVHDRK